ncbi:contractile injection system protein, VgrG/Pvc8 family [Aquisalimonas asiatica]|uniref:Uncharacterized conserved protein, implicated in type VI secretion and phage assembly n=1 Tax=Aquisalimonas asiatica TaxID=406100 RepID=A0A1H8SAK3_9GAMM|nr:contractile injection system protein, VgrG/Pvc8 family [Aquisalimonas asiatica]SEO75587.1 Uncharacterized conserved protein, implicated in type VI secretion and phage assembly [Aquisalimonas asiatica]
MGFGTGRPWARVFFAGQSFRVSQFEGYERISQPYRYRVVATLARSDTLPHRHDVVGGEAVLQWNCGVMRDGSAPGIVTRYQAGDCPDSDKRYAELVIEPALRLLDHDFDTRLYTRVDVKEQVLSFVESVGYADAHEWKVREDIPQREHVLQAAESTFAFMQRLLARAGVFYVWGGAYRDAYPWQTMHREELSFVDDTGELPVRSGPLRFSNKAHPEPGEFGIDRYRLVTRRPIAPQPLTVHRLQNREERKHLERVRRERSEATRYLLRGWGPQADLHAGMRFRPDGLASSERDGETRWQEIHLITHVEHRFWMKNLDGEPVPTFRTYIEAHPEIRGDTPFLYRPPEPEPAERPLVMSARVVSAKWGAPQAKPGGGARIAMPDKGEASNEVARVIPYNTAKPRAGWYTPLVDQNRVLVSCFNHDPDMPVILGVLPTASNAQPSARKAGRDGAYRTQGGQGLTVERAGERASENARLTLHSPRMQGFLDMTLDGEDGTPPALVSLACEKGLLHLESGSAFSEYAGGDRAERIEGGEQVTVNELVHARTEASLRAHAHTGLAFRGGDGARLQAGGDRLQLRASERMQMRAADTVTLASTHGDVRFDARGHITLAGVGVSIDSSSGPLTITNASNNAGLAVHPDGRVRLWGTRVQLDTPGQLIMQGNVNYDSSAPAAESPVTVTPNKVKIPSEYAERDIQDAHAPETVEPAETAVLVRPRRYAAAPRDNADQPAHDYSGDNLRGPDQLTELQRSRYVLDDLREGYLYVLANEALACLYNTEDGQLVVVDGVDEMGLGVHLDALLVPENFGTVRIAFSEHPWTDRQRSRVLGDEDGARDRFMQPFNLDDRADQPEAWSLPGESAENGAASGRINGAFGIALDDPLGVVYGLADRVDAALEAIRSYMAEPDPDDPDGVERYRRATVAQTIEQLYRTGWEHEESVETVTRKYYSQARTHGTKYEPSPAHQRSVILTSGLYGAMGNRLSSHVAEHKRVEALTRYEARVAELETELARCASDRVVWLESWSDTDSTTKLGTAWETFDRNDPDDCQAFEYSVAVAVRGMCTQRHIDDSATANDPEFALFGRWMDAGPEHNPVYRALFGMPGLADAAAELERAEREADANDDGGDDAGWPAHLRAAANVIRQYHDSAPYNQATVELLMTSTTYALRNEGGRLRGASADSVDGFLLRQFGAPDGEALRGFMIRHGAYLEVIEETTEQAFRRIEASQASSAEGVRSAAPGRGDPGTSRAGRTRLIQVHDVVHRSESPAAPLDRAFGGGVGMAGMTGLSGIVVVWNLAEAVNSLGEEGLARGGAQAAVAIASLGSALNAALNNFAGVARVAESIPLAGYAVRALRSVGAARFFGYGGAIAIGVTYGLKTRDALLEGEYGQAARYAAAGVLLAVGDSALTYWGTATLVAFWSPQVALFVGIVAMVAGLWLLISGELKEMLMELISGEREGAPMELSEWLERSVFGTDNPAYRDPRFESLDEELTQLSVVLHRPDVLRVTWDDDGPRGALAAMTCYLPGFDADHSVLQVLVNGEPATGRRIVEEQQHAGALLRLEQPVTRGSARREVAFTIRYRPSPEFPETYVREATVEKPGWLSGILNRLNS